MTTSVLSNLMDRLTVGPADDESKEPLYKVGTKLTLHLPDLSEPIHVSVEHMYEKAAAAVLLV